MSPRSNQKPALGQQSTSKKHMTSMSCRLEPMIWSCDTGQQIPCFDRSQLIIIIISNNKKYTVQCKSRLHINVDVLFGLIMAGCTMLHDSRHCRRAYTPTTNTTAHDNHEKINSWVSFSHMVMGLCLAALRAARALLLLFYLECQSLIGFTAPFLATCIPF